MSSLRDLCRCGHVRSSHAEGPCKTCTCSEWFPAYPVFDSRLPDGVEPLRDYRNGLTLVACSHASVTNPGAVGARCAFCKGDAQTTDGFRLPVKRLVFAPRELTLL